MAAHTFSVGARIELSPDRFDSAAPSGTYTVVRQLPNDAKDREYRVKSATDGHERVVRESQIRSGPLPPLR